MKSLWLGLAFSIAICSPVRAEPPSPVEIYYAPTFNLEREDVTLIRSARKSIDFAAFTFTSFPIIDALADAGRRGVSVRILLDPSQIRSRQQSVISRLVELALTRGVTIRVKIGRDLMHLKSYAIDGQVLRSGSANFTASGLKRQNNDLVVIRAANAAARFQAEFEAVFSHAAPFDHR